MLYQLVLIKTLKKIKSAANLANQKQILDSQIKQKKC